VTTQAVENASDEMSESTSLRVSLNSLEKKSQIQILLMQTSSSLL